MTTPIQCGKTGGPLDLGHALAAQASDYIMLDVMKIGGVTGWLRAAALAESQAKRVSNHLWPEISAQLLFVTPNAHWLEYAEWWNPILAESLSIKDGMTEIGDTVGIRDAFTQKQPSSEEARRKLRTRYDSELKSFLTPLQFTRLQQIDWQIRDHNALTDADVMFALKMTEAQQEKLLKAQQAFLTKRRELTTAMRELNILPADFENQTKESIAERDRSVEEILTKRQRDKYTELKGKPFDGPGQYWYEKIRGGGSKPKSP